MERPIGGEEDAQVPPSQSFANSARISDSVQLNDLRFMLFLFSLHSTFIFLQCGVLGRSLNYLIFKHVIILAVL